MSTTARQPGERWNCQACEKPLVGARTQTGAVAPIEVEARGDGNVLLHKIKGEVSAWQMGDAVLTAARAMNVELRMNHFATCPERERFKRT